MSWTAQFLLALQLPGVCLGAQQIAILFDFKSPPEAAVVNVMKSEIREILAPAELNMTFRRLGDVGPQTFQKIVVVRFQGVCRSGWSADPIQLDQPALLDHPSLGRTEVSEGRVMPYVHIFCNEVRAFVPTMSRTSQEQMYGRALGRVVTHELYHALLSTLEHAQAGLARPAQSARDLTGEKFALDPRSLHRLHEMWGAGY
jgi:hypothetical protein